MNGSSSKKRTRNTSTLLQLLLSFLLGCLVCTSLFNVLNYETLNNAFALHQQNRLPQQLGSIGSRSQVNVNNNEQNSSNILSGKSILVALASYDFSQIPHLEEVLDGYRDLCEAGAHVDLVIHSTVPYPIPLIDVLNSRLQCSNPENFTITISLHSPSLMLHLVDLHRPLFYDKLEEYDIFVYSEDDIRVRPTTIAAYMQETNRVIDLVGEQESNLYNVGIVRYEYNFPPDIIIDDKTRHATKDVERVYWEHVGKPVEEKAILRIENKDLSPYYVSMGNHHQGMFIATRSLLKAWKRDGCNFDVVRDRPGMKNRPSQPTEGTQRVWMSSQMLYGSRHCNVKQLLPMENFGALTVLHLPNKNYRRVGKKGRLGAKEDAPENEFGDGTERFAGPDPSLLTAMQLHTTIYKHFSQKQKSYQKYKGIMMVDEREQGAWFRGKQEHDELVKNTMIQFEAYVARGGVLQESDLDSSTP